MTASPPFVRRVELEASPGVVVATIEDFNHHFEVTLSHDGSVITGATLDAVRAPWTECSGAGSELGAFVGAPVGIRPNLDAPNLQCTHQLDVACVGVRFAGSGLAWRRYDVTVTGWDEPVVRATVERDDGLRLDWTLDGQTITGPEPYAGRTLGAGFASWAVRTFDDDTAEAALVLRRAAWMAGSRGMDLDDYPTLAATGMGEGVCFAAQPQRIGIARRNVGMARPVVQFPRRN